MAGNKSGHREVSEKVWEKRHQRAGSPKKPEKQDW